jgi:phosphoribosylamine--glycine ligase
MLEAARGDLTPAGDPEWDARACVGVVVASGGYPDSYETGFPINGLADIPPGILVFHAGTRYVAGKGIVTAGGRVLTLVALADGVGTARAKVLEAVARVRFEGAFHRRDIALEAAARP